MYVSLTLAAPTLGGDSYGTERKKKRIGLYLDNRPFYSCVLSCLAMDASEAGGDLALIQTSLLFSCKCKLVSIRTT